eukprot:jgi/Mesvir1/13187/Mv06147-RA.1
MTTVLTAPHAGPGLHESRKPRRWQSVKFYFCLFLLPGILLMAALVVSVILIYRDYSRTAERSMYLLSLTARQEAHAHLRVKFTSYLESSLGASLSLSTAVQLSETSGDPWSHDGRWLSYLRIVNWAAFTSTRWCSTLGVLWEDGALLYVRDTPASDTVDFMHGWVNNDTGVLDLDTWHVPVDSSWRHCSMDACLGLMSEERRAGNASVAPTQDTDGGMPNFPGNVEGPDIAVQRDLDSDSSTHGGSEAASDTCFLETWVVDGNTTVVAPLCQLRPPDAKSQPPMTFPGMWPQYGAPSPGDPPLVDVSLLAQNGSVGLWVASKLFVSTPSALGRAHGGYMRTIVGMSFDSYMLREDLLRVVRPGGVAFLMSNTGQLIASTHGNITSDEGSVLRATQSDDPLVASAAARVAPVVMTSLFDEWSEHKASMETLPYGRDSHVIDYSILVTDYYTVAVVIVSPKRMVGIDLVPAGSKLFAGLLAVVITIFLLVMVLLLLLLRDWWCRGILQRLLRATVAKMEHALMVKSMFLANMSHELRTPLCAIQGYLDLLLLEAGHQGGVVREYSSLAKASAEDLLKMVNDILDLEKMSGGALRLESSSIILEQAMQAVFALFAAQVASKRGLELVLDVSPRVPMGVCGDVFRIKQVFINLISNAVRFTQQGYIKVTLDAVLPPHLMHASRGTTSHHHTGMHHGATHQASWHHEKRRRSDDLGTRPRPLRNALKASLDLRPGLIDTLAEGGPASATMALGDALHSPVGRVVGEAVRWPGEGLSMPSVTQGCSMAPGVGAEGVGGKDESEAVQQELPLVYERARYVPPGGREGDAPPPVRLVCTVEDSGSGIPEDQWEAVFDTFQQVDATATRGHGGTGLGLSVVRSLVRLMGGEVKIVPKEGPGTKVHFTLDLRICMKGAAFPCGQAPPPPPPPGMWGQGDLPSWRFRDATHVPLPSLHMPSGEHLREKGLHSRRSTQEGGRYSSTLFDPDLEGGLVQGVPSPPVSPSMMRSRSGSLVFSPSLAPPILVPPPTMPLCNVVLLVLPGPVERALARRWFAGQGMVVVAAGSIAEAHVLMEQRAAAKRQALARARERAGGPGWAESAQDPAAHDLGTVRYDVALVLIEASLLTACTTHADGAAQGGSGAGSMSGDAHEGQHVRSCSPPRGMPSKRQEAALQGAVGASTRTEGCWWERGRSDRYINIGRAERHGGGCGGC